MGLITHLLKCDGINHVIGCASGVALWMVVGLSWSTTLVQTKISQAIVLPSNMMSMFMVVVILVIP